jgi:hypothetical protein
MVAAVSRPVTAVVATVLAPFAAVITPPSPVVRDGPGEAGVGHLDP